MLLKYLIKYLLSMLLRVMHHNPVLSWHPNASRILTDFVPIRLMPAIPRRLAGLLDLPDPLISANVSQSTGYT